MREDDLRQPLDPAQQRISEYVRNLLIGLVTGTAISIGNGTRKYRNKDIPSLHGVRNKYQRLVTFIFSDAFYFIPRILGMTTVYMFTEDALEEYSNLNELERKISSGACTGMLACAWRGGILGALMGSVAGGGIAYGHSVAADKLNGPERKEPELISDRWMKGDWQDLSKTEPKFNFSKFKQKDA
mmetsp:Transcript_1865/g.5620  ORF Transcript_1865/g.5620 Transcript_1865/m.5620 type:complete len:185 (-) Transcript_1865:140-694(-)